MSARNAALRGPRLRRQAILVLVLTVLLVFSGRLVYVQAFQGQELADQAREDRTRTSPIRAPRGDIVDSDGEILATSVERYNVGVNQLRVRNYELKDEETGEVLSTGAAAAAEVLAPLLDRDKAELGAQMVGDSTFVYLAKGLTPEQWREIDALNIPGIEPEETTARIYPNGSTAGNIIGYVGRDRHGLAGLELTMDDVLTGKDGSLTVEIGATGQVIPTGHREEVPAVQGHTVHTTIDRDLQHVAQRSIDEAVEKHGGAWGAVVVEEIGTGRILALADSGSVDPGNYQDWAPEDRGSRAVSSPYEPGSTGKLPTFALALEQGKIDATTAFTVPDTLTMPNGQTFRDNSPHETRHLTTTGALQMSSNTATVQIGDMVDDRDRFNLLRGLGFGRTTGVELPGEAAGVVRDPDDWDGRTRYTTMFGQGMSVTLLQNTSMVATLGNGGVRVDPHIVDGTTDGDGQFSPTEVGPGEQVLSEETADTMLAMMESVVQKGGTGPQGAVDGYRVAAKTGTAEILDAAGGLSNRLGSYVGVAPAENPRVAVGVVVYRGAGTSYGGTVAGPTFSEVMGFALRDMGVPPSTEPTPDLPLESGQ
ncbi:cell division protein FtsI (penicillin-binding protein 3) [Georgenia soli]|uniref:Cell division protein FtsI (Penicillin-binding protein 3) n=1 Tax=Georgenia soli TaxID=638953 RepID=A0A2A9EJK3_9MICO|nr:penicillin-binding protein 2 [Georgenia soli]PFG38409.1 cell division protein FtsI (penicillin-binding protein 3) [Georgenia soli]